MSRQHRYVVDLAWTGDRGTGTSTYRAYSRDHVLASGGKATILGSSDPNFRGDAGRWSPEELLIASLSACHQLWYLHLCAEAGVVVTAYEDQAEGMMVEETSGEGQFVSAVLRPRVTITADSDAAIAERLHDAAHQKCFVARSMNFPVSHEPVILHAAD